MFAVREGLGLGRRDGRVGVDVVDDRRLDVFVRLLALVCLEAVGHKVVAVPHLDGLLGLRVLAAMRALFMVHAFGCGSWSEEDRVVAGR